MQTTTQKDKLQRTGFSHSKRYSDLDFRTNKLDKLLITQTSLFSQPKIKIIKTKLPLLPTYNVTTTSSNHSHAKIAKISQGTSELEEQLGSLNQGLQVLDLDIQELKICVQRQRSGLTGRLKQTHQSLMNKINRLSSMIEFSKSEGRVRSESLMEDCTKLQQSNDMISSCISRLRERMRNLQNSLGHYTGQDKYLA